MQLSHHVNELDAGERDASSDFGLETEHGSYPSFDKAMILFDGVVHGLDRDGPFSLSQPALDIALDDGRPIGLATVNCDLLWPAMSGQRLADKAFSSFQVVVSIEQQQQQQLEGTAVADNGTKQIHPTRP